MAKDIENSESGAGYSGSKGSDGQKDAFGVKKSSLDKGADVAGKDGEQYKDINDKKQQTGSE